MPPSHLPKLPSMTELLQHPSVEKVLKRVNQSTVAQRATGFLAELQASLRDKADHSVPSLSQLAERLARRLMGPPGHAVSAINATGEIFSARWQTPLSDAAQQEMLRVAGEFHEATPARQEQVCELLCELSGAEAAWVLSSYRVASDLASGCDDLRVDLAHIAGLVDPSEPGPSPSALGSVRTISARIESGAELVVCDGAGLLGGPSCGIVVGRTDAIEKLRRHVWADVLAAENMQLVALAATLLAYRRTERVIHQIPIWQLLSTPLENLRQRCERLAPLIAESQAIAAAVPAQCESPWYVGGQMQLGGPTWAIQLRPADDTAEHTALQLAEASPMVAARLQQGALWFDMRSVFPRWDQRLVEVFRSI